MAVDRDDRLVDVGYAVEQHRDERRELLGNGVTHRIGNVDGRGAGGDRGFDGAAEEIGLRAGTVLATPLHVVAEIARACNAVDDRLVHLLGLHLQLVFHVQRAGCNEGVDAFALGRFERFRRAFDILPVGPRQPAYDRGGDGLGNLLHGLEIAVRRDGETGLDDIDAELVQHLGDAQLFLQVHGRARRLLAVAQSRVENDDSVVVLALAHLFGPSLRTVAQRGSRVPPLNGRGVKMAAFRGA